MNKTAIKDVMDAQRGEFMAAAEWTRAARKELIGRVIQSPSFARSERLSSLLTYVCEMALEGRGAELNEQRIGNKVFGRPRDYDSSNDGIVRTQASRLRHRLDEYFAGEGSGEAIRIEIPKGGYVPIFTEMQVATPPREAHPADVVPPAFPDFPAATIEPAQPSRWPVVLPWILCAAAMIFAAIAWVRGGRMQQPPPHPLWSKVFTPSRPTLEVPGDSGLVLSYVFTHHSVSLSEYMTGSYRSTASSHDSGSPEAIQADIANRRYTSIVDLAIAVNLQKIAQSRESSLQVRFARDLRPNDLKSGNSILIGAFEGNPWLELFESRMKFQMVNDYRQHVFSVINRTPKPGEPDRWVSAAADPQRRVYGVVALLPNLSGDGNVLIVEGTSMAGVEAAWDFVSDDEVLLPLLRRMQKPDGTLPPFEFLVGTQNMGASAAHADLIAWDTH